MRRDGVFVDASEYRRNCFNVEGGTFAALAEMVQKGSLAFLQTDVTISEIKALVLTDMKEAHALLRKSVFSALGTINEGRFHIFQSLPSVHELATLLIAQFERHLEVFRCEFLKVSDVDPAVIFQAYFNGTAPFDSQKKKMEFPDAFALQRLALWAEKSETVVYVVGPDPDLERVCQSDARLRHFARIELLLDHLNRAEAIVARLKAKPTSVIETLEAFTKSHFTELEFELEYNPHGDVENVVVQEVEITDILALAVEGENVQAAAIASVGFTGDFSYEDRDTGWYDRESGERYFAEYVRGEVEDTRDVTIHLTFSVDKEGLPIVSNLSLEEETITVQEEDRGDYGQYK